MQMNVNEELDEKDAASLTVLSIAAAQQENICYSLGKTIQFNALLVEELHQACKNSISDMKTHLEHETGEIRQYMQSATEVAHAILAAVDSKTIKLLQPEDAEVRVEADFLMQELFQFAPADFWDFVIDDIKAIKATTQVVIDKHAECLNRTAGQTSQPDNI